jgi:hypothetical protein
MVSIQMLRKLQFPLTFEIKTHRTASNTEIRQARMSVELALEMAPYISSTQQEMDNTQRNFSRSKLNYHCRRFLEKVFSADCISVCDLGMSQ